MDEREKVSPRELASAVRNNGYEDVKSLWERWDKSQKEDSPSELVRGTNLIGIGMIIAGTMFQTLGAGLLKDFIAPLFLFAGAVIVAFKRFKKLWLERSVDS